MNGDRSNSAPTALVSWAHASDAGALLEGADERWAADDAWLSTVVDFVTALRLVGNVAADVDVAHSAEPVDWSRWGPSKVDTSDFVIVAMNKAWARRFTGEERPTVGAGATAEADELLGIFESDRDVFDQKVIIVALRGASVDDVPNRLRGRVTRFKIDTLDEAGLEELLRRIHGRPRFVLPPLRGEDPHLPPVKTGGPGDREASGSVPEGEETVAEASGPTPGGLSQSVTRLSTEELRNRLLVVESGLRGLPAGAANDDLSLPWARHHLRLSREQAGLSAELEKRSNSDDRTIRLMWVDSDRELRGYQGEVSPRYVEDGWIVPRTVDTFPGPPGRFLLLPEDLWLVIDPADPTPVFLHDSYQAFTETWVQPIGSPSEEVAAARRARDAVILLVESRLAAEPHAFSITQTVTRTEFLNGELAVVGRCVMVRPTPSE